MEPSSASPALVPPVFLRGFTLVEMVVVLGIITIITAVVINGQSSYNKTLLLNDTAYTVAYSVRQAQSLGLSSRNYQGSGNYIGYGVHFSSGAPGSYSIFPDSSNATYAIPSTCTVGVPGTPEWKPGNCRYNPADGTAVQTYTFSRGLTIQSFCGKSGGTLTCSPTLSSLDIVFMRPNTNAIITGNNGTSYSCAEIRIADPSGAVTRVIRVSLLGEISVGQSCP